MSKQKKTNTVHQPAAHDNPRAKPRRGKSRDAKTRSTPIGAGDVSDSEAFLNRELGAISFNKTVQSLARDPQVPLLERLRYLCIVSSNLDEFFEIRLAELRERMDAGDRSLSIDGRSARETYEAAIAEANHLQTEQYRLFNQDILPALAEEGIVLLRREDWTEKQKQWISDYFIQEILPLLTPIGLDPAHPFPRLANKSLNFLVELSGKDAYGRTGTVAIVPAPHSLPRIIRLPNAISGHPFAAVFLSSALRAHAGQLFPGMKIIGFHQFRVTRNSDLFVDEEEVKNLLATIQGELPQRNFGAAVRLEVADTCPKTARDFLLRHFNLTQREMAICEGPVNLVRLMRIPDMVDRPDLKFPDFKPGYPKALLKRGVNMFEAIAKGDILLHHPYQSYSPVAQLLSQASEDPNVSAIKMTVYRTGEDSSLMESLVRAAQMGKEVTVVLELMARFDEAANIRWAARLEEAGAHVVFGAVGYKTHAKMLMIVRREIDSESGVAQLRRYVHLGTGNYNPKTAKLYTDFSLFTRDPGFGSDAAEIFQQLTGLGQPQELSRLAQAPFGLHKMILAGIKEQTALASQGKPSMIRAKMNAILEPDVIRALYQASAAGVPVKLIVRGMCALRPGMTGLSEHIEVRSVVGRYLEHHRLFAFGDGDAAQVWLSSADWMDRNFFRRIEVAFPILDKKLRRRALHEGFETYWNSKKNVYALDASGIRRLIAEKAQDADQAQLQLSLLMGRAPSA
jgi:polyphosphate kinase